LLSSYIQVKIEGMGEFEGNEEERKERTHKDKQN
jgi:hypothetical protein